MLLDRVKIVNKVILGRRERTLSQGLEHAYNLEFSDGIDKAFRRGAIELVCTKKGDILLIMKGYKGGGHSVGPGLSDRASLLIDSSLTGGWIDIKRITFLSREYFDTLVSNPLSKQEITSILKALKKRKSTSIGFSTMDGGNAFAGNAKISDVKMLIDRCQKIKQ
jgi:hypothetical protein